MNEIDRDALRRAIKAYRALGAEENEEIDRKLADGKPFEEIGTSAAYRCQRRSLDLKPWESPPMFGDVYPNHDGHADAEVLLRKLQDAGLSRYEPNPTAALAAAAVPRTRDGAMPITQERPAVGTKPAT